MSAILFCLFGSTQTLASQLDRSTPLVSSPYGAWAREPGNEVAKKNWKSSPFLFIRASICINCFQLHLCKVLRGNYLSFTQFNDRSHVLWLNFDKFRDSQAQLSLVTTYCFIDDIFILLVFEIFLCLILVLTGIPRRSVLLGGVPGYSGVFRGVPGLFLVIQTPVTAAPWKLVATR